MVNVQGLASLGGTLGVTPIDDFQPKAGDVFNVLNFASRSGAFDDVFLPDLEGGPSWNDSQLATSGILTVVPEPSTFILTALGLLAILGWGWRRRG